MLELKLDATMPKDCGWCWFQDGEGYCIPLCINRKPPYKSCEAASEGIREDCPLKEIKE